MGIVIFIIIIEVFISKLFKFSPMIFVIKFFGKIIYLYNVLLFAKCCFEYLLSIYVG